MSINSIMTPLADAVRLKTGKTEILGVEDMTSALNNIPTQGTKTITPGTADKVAIAKGVFTTGPVTVAGDSNLSAENIAEGVTVFGVTGVHKAAEATVKACTVSIDLSMFYDTRSFVAYTELTSSGEPIVRTGTLNDYEHTLNVVTGNPLVLVIPYSSVQRVTTNISSNYASILYSNMNADYRDPDINNIIAIVISKEIPENETVSITFVDNGLGGGGGFPEDDLLSLRQSGETQFS